MGKRVVSRVRRCQQVQLDIGCSIASLRSSLSIAVFDWLLYIRQQLPLTANELLERLNCSIDEIVEQDQEQEDQIVDFGFDIEPPQSRCKPHTHRVRASIRNRSRLRFRKEYKLAFQVSDIHMALLEVSSKIDMIMLAIGPSGIRPKELFILSFDNSVIDIESDCSSSSSSSSMIEDRIRRRCLGAFMNVMNDQQQELQHSRVSKAHIFIRLATTTTTTTIIDNNLELSSQWHSIASTRCCSVLFPPSSDSVPRSRELIIPIPQSSLKQCDIVLVDLFAPLSCTETIDRIDSSSDNWFQLLPSLKGLVAL